MTVAATPSKPTGTPRQHSSGSLDDFKSTVVTPVIGNEFPKGSINIVDDILKAPNSEQRIRDLAILSPSPPISHLLNPSLSNKFQSPNAASSSSAHKTT